MSATISKSELIRSLQAAHELLVRNSRNNFKTYIQLLDKDYTIQFFHAYIISRLEAFERGEIKKLMIFVPPQNGKSQLTSRLFPSYLIGKNPKRKIIIASYAATIAHEFARDAKNYITSNEFAQVFPNVKIGAVKDIEGSFSDASFYYQTNPDKGFIYGVGRGGPLTGKSIDIGIIDDPFKDKEEVMSLSIREKLWNWYINVYKTRMHNGSQEILIQTRWDKDDLAGRILKEESDWEVIKFPAIRTKDYCDYDQRSPGDPLWPEKHSLESIMAQKKKSEATFNALYQQDPKPNNKLLVHPDFVIIDKIPYESIERWIIGLDYGYTNDPSAIVAIGVWKNKRYWRSLIYHKQSSGDRNNVNISAEQIKEVLVQENLNNSAMYSEHDEEMVSQLRRLGLPVKIANKSVYAGIQCVNNYENYYLDSDTYLHNERINYQFKTIGEMILNDPVDGNDHIMNAGRYAIYTDQFRG